MKDLNKIMDDIDNKKEMIAKAISLAFCDGNIDKAEKEYSEILRLIKETRVGVIKTNDHKKTPYEREVDELLDKISPYLGIDAKSFYYKKVHMFTVDPLKAYNLEGIDENLEKKLKKTYLSGVKTFLKLGVSYDDFINKYRELNDDVFKLSKMVKILQRKMVLYDTKKIFSLEKEKATVKELINQFGDVVDEYSVVSMDDFMNLYTEICSSLMDDSNITEEEKKIIEENRDKLCKRVGKYFINQEDLVGLKKRFEQLYKNYSMNKCLRESNLDDIICRNNLTMDKQVFKHFVSFYGYVHTVDGFNVYSKIHGKYINFTFLHDVVFERYNESQDLIIIHELIHSVEPHVRGVRPFNNECEYFNEALTEYFAREAYKYMETNIINDTCIEKGEKEYISIYDCMLPLVKVLKDSPLWNDIVYCKKVNDYSLFKDRAEGYASKISKLFNNVFSKSQKGELDFETFMIYKVELLKLVKNILEECPRYSKIKAI